MATDWKTLLEIRQKYGIPISSLQPPPLTEFNKRLQSNQTQATNYNTRLGAINEDVAPEETKKKNWFFKAIEAIDKPRNAVWNALEDSAKGENSFMQGLKEGWTGEEKYYGTDLMEDFGVKNKFAKGVGGFAAEAILDPLNLVSLGAGSFTKGALTGSAKTLTREGAEQLAKAALREVSETAIRKSAKFAGKSVKGGVIRNAMKTGAGGILKGLGASTDDMLRLAKSSIANSADSARLWDDILDTATNAIQKNQDILLKSKGRGLKIAGKEFATAGKMQDLGAALNKKVLGADNIVGKTATKFNDMVSTVFSSKHISGVDKNTQKIFKILEQRKKGARHLLDSGTEKQYKQFLDVLGRHSKEDFDKYDKTLMNILEGRVTLDKVPDDIKTVYMDIAKNLEDIGLSETAIMKLKKQAKNYAPHVQAWDLSKGDQEILQKFARGGDSGTGFDVYNRAAQARKFGDDVDVSNILINFDTSGDAARRAYLNSIANQVPSRVMDIRKVRKYSDLTGILADEGIKGTAAYNILSRNADGLDGVSGFFETSAVKSWMSRALQHNKIISEAGFIEDVKSAFGRTIRNVDEIRDARRAGQVIVMPQSYAKKARIDENILQQLKSFQADPLSPYLTLDDDEVNLIMKYFGQTGQLSNPLRSGDMVALPKGMVQKINGSARAQTEAGTKALTKMVDKFYSLWKPTVTGLRPDYHIRNLFGSTMNNMYDVGFKAIDPKTQGMAAKVLRKATKNTDSIELGGTRFTVGEIRDQIEKQAVKMNLHIAEFGDVAKTHQIKFARAQDGTLQNIARHPLHGAAEAGKAVGETIEGQVRTSNFLANVDTFLGNGMSVDAAFEAAGEQVRKYHFDYGDLTNAEIKGIRRLLPFYTWFRKNAPLQLEELLNKPVRATFVNKWNRNISAAEGYDLTDLPDYVQENMALAMPRLGLGMTDEDNIPMANIGVPQADLAMLGSPGFGRDLASMSNPLLKAPIEMLMNQNMMTGAPIYSNEYEKGEKLAKHAQQQFGIVNDIAQTISPRDYEGATMKPQFEGSPLRITNSLFKEFDSQEAKLDASYSYNRALANKVQYLKSQGVPVPDLNKMDIEMIQQLSDEDIEMIKELGEFPAVFYKNRTTALPSDERSTFSQALEKYRSGMY